MTMTLTYLPDLSRVRIQLTDLSPPTDVVQIQRAALTAEPPWTVVRGGDALPVSRTSGAQFDGAGGSNVASGDTAQLSITGDIDLRADAELDDWFTGTTQALLGKDTIAGNNRSYGLFINSGLIQIRWSTDGAAAGTSLISSTETIHQGRQIVRATLDVDDGSGNHVVTFYTGTSITGPWFQVGDQIVIAGTTSIADTTSQLEVGSVNQGGAFQVVGIIHQIQVYDGIDGTIVANPDFDSRPAGMTGFTDSAGSAWQFNGTTVVVQESFAQLDDFEFFQDILNWYRVLPVEPPSGLRLPGGVGDNADTPDDASLDIVGDIELVADFTVDLTDLVSSPTFLLAKWNDVANQQSYALVLFPTGQIAFQYSDDGSATTRLFASETVETFGPERFAFRASFDVDDGNGNQIVRFFRGENIDGPWFPFGEPNIETGVASIFASTAVLEVGASDAGTMSTFIGVIHAAIVRDGIAGTEVANPRFFEQASGTTSFTDDAGKLWTLGGNASIAGELLEQSSITPVIAPDTWLKNIRFPFLNRNINTPFYEFVQRASRSGIFNVKGRSLPIATHDIRASRQWTITTATDTLADAEDFDLVMAANGTSFVQPPEESENACFTNPVTGQPGGYVNIAITTQRHVVPGSHTFTWVLPLREVAKPVASVVGATMVWGTVWRLYDTWTELWAANATWRDLWDQVGQPIDLVFR